MIAQLDYGAGSAASWGAAAVPSLGTAGVHRGVMEGCPVCWRGGFDQEEPGPCSFLLSAHCPTACLYHCHIDPALPLLPLPDRGQGG